MAVATTSTAAATAAAPAPAPASQPVSVVQTGDLWLTTSKAGQVQRYSRVSRLSDGSYVAVRDSYMPGQTFGDKIVLMARLDNDGNPVGAETTIASGSAPGVTAFSDGSFLLTWLEPPPPTFTLIVGVTGQRYDVGGRPLGTPMSLGSAPSFAQPTALSDGSFALGTFGQSSRVNGPGGSVTRYTREGAAAGSDTALQDDACGIGGPPAVAALSAGGYVVAWPYTCLSVRQVRMLTFNAAGSQVASSRMPVGGQAGLSVNLATLTTGKVVVEWSQADAVGAHEVRAQIVDPASLPTSTEAAISVPVEEGRSPLAVQALAAGGFLVPWSALSEDEARVPVSRYSNTGERL